EVQFNQITGADGNSFVDYNGDEHSFNWFEYLNAVSPSERFNFSTSMEYQLNDSSRFYSDILYSKRNSRQVVTPRGIRPMNVSADFAYNPTGQDLTLKRRRMIELGAPYFYQKVETTQALLGFEGELTNGWQWDASASYGRNTAFDGWTHDVDQQRIAQTLDMDQCSMVTNAAIPCGDYFGVGELDQNVLNYISYRREGTGGNQMKNVNLSLTGDLMDFSAGPLAFATGVEYRAEKGWRNPDPVVLANGGEDTVAGDFNVTEAFVEFEMPLFSDDLNLAVAGRYSDYSTFGSNSTYKMGLTWQTSEALMLRLVRSSAMRTPSIPELFGGTNQENLLTIDPCENAATPQIQQNCLAGGVPTDFIQDGSTVLTGVGGNQDVQPEEADTLTVGLVFEPTQIKGLSMTIDYFDVEIDNAIGSVDGTNQLRLCYSDPALYQMYCDGFTRNGTTHQIESLQRKPLNAAIEAVSGWDMNVAYVTECAGLQTRLSFDTTRLFKHQNRAFADAETQVLLGKITADRGSFAKWKGSVSATIGTDVWRTSWSLRYLGKADDENGGGDIGKAVPSIVYNDIQASWMLSDGFSVSLGIDNVFDKKAPYLTSWNDANTDVFTYDLIGRRLFLQANWRL
ncbi:MAG: TonB-dependent receptor, partial [Psychrosphaera sp.]|nr:TonB-dependent receptor [Psychrosphaera sp.]